MNKSGVWKSLEVKQNDERKSSKDDSPDEGLTLKVKTEIFDVRQNNQDVFNQ